MIWVKCSIFGVKPVSKRIRGRYLLGKLKKKKYGVFFTLIGAISDHVGLGITLSTCQGVMIVLVDRV